MVDSIIQSFDIWIDAQGVKSKGRVKSVENISLEGIARLRELILELAVRGKLVPQDPNDEPANELLKRIEMERKALNETVLLDIEENEKSFALPTGWEWVRLQQIIQISSGDGLTAANMNGNGSIPVFGGNGINGCHDKNNVSKPTLVIGRVGFYCGSIHITPNYAWVTDNAFITTFSEANIYIKFLSWLLNGTNLKENDSATAQPVISGRKIYPIVVALPPLKEQHCIVAKVDELMALCDKLEEQQTNNLKTHQLLVKTILETLTQAADANELQAAWERMATHFDNLFCTEDSIDQLKQIILQLAVMGKLVPQNLDDEPASLLLEKIAKEKAHLVKEGKIKKQSTLLEITEEEKSFNLPIGWTWAKLQTLVFLLGDGLHGTPTYTDETNYYFINGNNLNDGKIEIKPGTKTVSKEEMLKYKKALSSNTVLVSINGTLGKVAFYNGEEIMLGKSACYFNLSENVYKYYIKVVLESKYYIDYAIRNATGTTIKNLGLKAMNDFPIPLPSLPEQHRIVAKVDELLAVCDALKVNILKAEEIKVQLAEAVVESATA